MKYWVISNLSGFVSETAFATLEDAKVEVDNLRLDGVPCYIVIKEVANND